MVAEGGVGGCVREGGAEDAVEGDKVLQPLGDKIILM